MTVHHVHVSRYVLIAFARNVSRAGCRMLRSLGQHWVKQVPRSTAWLLSDVRRISMADTSVAPSLVRTFIQTFMSVHTIT
jgi:hypothetical protein